MSLRSVRSTISAVGIGAAVLCSAQFGFMAKADSAPRFHLYRVADAQLLRGWIE